MTDDGVRAFNGAADARDRLRVCCAAPGWADAVAAGRPYADRVAVVGAADRASAGLDWPAVVVALADHPPIGRPGTGRSAAWSAAEQSAAADGDPGELAAANEEYRRRFGHVFLVCADGLGAGEVLAALRERLDNDPATERAVVRRELAAIARLRLGRLLDELAVRR